MTDSDESITVTVLRSSDASKVELEVSLNQTLDDVKNAISSSSLGPLSPNYQRLFHLGRELKSGHRSLDKLGVGRFRNFLLHLHSTQPAPCELSSDDDDDDDDEVIEVEGPAAPKRSAAAAAVIDLMDDDDSEDEFESAGKRQRVSLS